MLFLAIFSLYNSDDFYCVNLFCQVVYKLLYSAVLTIQIYCQYYILQASCPIISTKFSIDFSLLKANIFVFLTVYILLNSSNTFIIWIFLGKKKHLVAYCYFIVFLLFKTKLSRHGCCLGGWTGTSNPTFFTINSTFSSFKRRAVSEKQISL